MPNTRLEAAGAADLEAVAELLTSAGLPVPDARDNPVHLEVLRDAGALLACAGWELYGTHALLRSVAVSSERRGQGLGERVVGAALEALRSAGVSDVYLLTTDAAGFFTRLGFAPVARDRVPASVRSSRQFGGGCCSTAQAMHRVLG